MSARERAAEVLDWHRFDPVGRFCSCGVECGVVCDNLTHPQHLADVLTEAGLLTDGGER